VNCPPRLQAPFRFPISINALTTVEQGPVPVLAPVLDPAPAPVLSGVLFLPAVPLLFPLLFSAPRDLRVSL
jgi:hypothetical protein